MLLTWTPLVVTPQSNDSNPHAPRKYVVTPPTRYLLVLVDALNLRDKSTFTARAMLPRGSPPPAASQQLHGYVLTRFTTAMRELRALAQVADLTIPISNQLLAPKKPKRSTKGTLDTFDSIPEKVRTTLCDRFNPSQRRAIYEAVVDFRVATTERKFTLV